MRNSAIGRDRGDDGPELSNQAQFNNNINFVLIKLNNCCRIEIVAFKRTPNKKSEKKNN